MSLSSCKECGREISSNAVSCPGCGSQGRRVGFWPGIGILFIVAIIAITIRSNRDSTDVSSRTEGVAASSPSLEVSSPSKQFALSEKQKSFLRMIVEEDLRVFASGASTTLFGGLSSPLKPLKISADDLQKQYERNEVAGDRKFRGQVLLVSAEVASIDRSIGENYFLSLKGGSNMFIRPKAHMADDQTDYLANLKKGQKVKLACWGDGMLLGSAMLTGCIPSEEWVKITLNWFIDSMPEQIAEKDEYSMATFLLSHVLSEKLAEKSECWGGDIKSCNKEMADLTKHHGKKDGLIPEMRATAIKFGISTAWLDEKKTQKEGESTRHKPDGV